MPGRSSFPALPALVARVALVALIAFLAACTSTSGPESPTAQIRLLNAAGQVPSLEVAADGRVVIGPVPAGQASGYAEVPVAASTLTVRSPGSNTALATIPVTLEPAGRYAVLASASMVVLQAAGGLDTGAVRPDRANIRIVNVAPPATSDSSNQPAPILLDVHITPPGTALGGRQSELSMDARYPSYSTFLYFAPETLVVRFAIAGTETVVAASPVVTLTAGDARAIMLERRPDKSFQITVLTES